MDDSINIALRLASAARNALNGDSFSFASADYMDRIDFRFLPRNKSIFGGYSTMVADSWYNHLEALGLVKVYADFDYYNVQTPTVCCVFSDGAVTGFGVSCAVKRAGHLETDIYPDYFTALRHFQPSWMFRMYTAMRTKVSEAQEPRRSISRENNIVALKRVFMRAEEFMHSHGKEFSAKQFQLAQRILDGREDSHLNRFVSLPDLPEDRLRIYKACTEADAYDPRIGISREFYEIYTDGAFPDEVENLHRELLTETRTALLYAINS